MPRVVSTPLLVVFNLSSDEVFLVLAVDIFILSKQFLFTFCQLYLNFWVISLLYTKFSVKQSIVVRVASNFRSQNRRFCVRKLPLRVRARLIAHPWGSLLLRKSARKEEPGKTKALALGNRNYVPVNTPIT